MARIRTIKPEFFTSADIVELTPLARLFYVSLWCEADREGRLNWNLKTLKMRYLPGDDCDINLLADELIESGLIIIYEVEQKCYAEIPRFENHQVINNRESKSQIPERVSDACVTRKSGVQGEGKGKEGKGKERKDSSSEKKFSDEDLDCAKWMFEKIRDLNPGQKPPNFDKWADSIRLMRERDCKTDTEIRDLFGWANNHHFWQTNILSPSKLREKWDDLTIKRKAEASETHQRPSNQESPLDRFNRENGLAPNMGEGMAGGIIDLRKQVEGDSWG